MARPLTAYVGKRLLLLIPTLLGVSVLTFLLIHLIPGDLVTILLGITASQNEQTRQALIHALHLDRPLAVQYLLWLGEVLRGDLGHSLVTGFSVRDELARSYPVTLQLALMAMSIALAVGIPLGVLAATRAGRALDASARVFSLLFISAPAFFIGTVVIIAGARYAPWLPTLGHVPFTESPARSLVTMLPAAASLGLAISAIVARFTRSSMLEVLGQDFVRTARAKGVADRAVVYKHALRNALIPVVAMAGTQFVYLIGGAVIIEEVFALPGMGRLVVNAIYQRDYTTIQGAVLLLTSGAVLVNLGPRSALSPDRPSDPVRVSDESGGVAGPRRRAPGAAEAGRSWSAVSSSPASWWRRWPRRGWRRTRPPRSSRARRSGRPTRASGSARTRWAATS